MKKTCLSLLEWPNELIKIGLDCPKLFIIDLESFAVFFSQLASMDSVPDPIEFSAGLTGLYFILVLNLSYFTQRCN